MKSPRRTPAGVAMALALQVGALGCSAAEGSDWSQGTDDQTPDPGSHEYANLSPEPESESALGSAQATSDSEILIEDDTMLTEAESDADPARAQIQQPLFSSSATVIWGDFGTTVIGDDEGARCTHSPKNYYACYVPRSKTVRWDARQTGISPWWLDRLDNAIARAMQITEPLGFRWIEDHSSDDYIDIEYLPGGQSLPDDLLGRTKLKVSSADCTDNGFWGRRIKGVCGAHQADVRIDSNKVWDYANALGLNTTQHGYMLEAVILHELMHALGLGHSSNASHLMARGMGATNWFAWDITDYERQMLSEFRP